jgi:hypothetical protein
MASTPVPGVNGTTMVTGRTGQVCAINSAHGSSMPASHGSLARTVKKWNFRICITFCSVKLRHHYCPIRLFFPHVDCAPARG